MVNEWKELSFNELGEVNRGRSKHRPRYAEHLYGGPYPFIQTGDIKASNGRIVKHTQTYSKAGLGQSRLWPKDTMCITIAANIAETAILTYPACFPDSVVGFIANENKCDVRFIEYSFRLLKQRIQSEATGSVQDNINLATLSRLTFPIPPLPEQKKIVHILGSLDDKIELNRQMNATLEGMAQALFKSWFVDFDPVIDNALAAGNPIPEAFAARAETRRKALAHGTANRDVAKQFPEAFQFTEEMGWIPEGWKVVEAKEQIDVLRGFSYKGKGLCKKDEGVPMHNLNSVLEGGGYKYEGIKYYNLEFKEKFKIQQGDILVANTEQGHNHLLIGYGSMVPLFYKEGFFSHHLYRVRPKKNAIVTPEFIDQLFKPGNFVYQVQGYTNGTTVNMLPIVGLQLSKFICPPKDLVKLFSHQYKSIFCKKEKNYLNNLEIEQLRDTLLPKLISGEIRIPEAEKLTEEALA